jgi:hypothetical protein
MKRILPVMLLFWVSIGFAQTNVFISGTVKNAQGELLEGVSVHVHDTKNMAATSINGRYSVLAYSGTIKVSFSLSGYFPEILTLDLHNIQMYSQDIVLRRYTQSLEEVIIESGINGTGNIKDIDSRLVKNIPSVSGNFEALVKTLPGVSPNNELSSRYSVRGGNFDENLIYVNDIEIFRPVLIHNGQQEGLSFINQDLISRSSFSAGGFQARYGDKLSSVLDVRYSRPDSTETMLTAGLTGLSATVKTISKNKKTYLLLGLRDKTNRTILQKQDVKGSYNSHFYDFQFLAKKDISQRFSLSLLGDYNTGKLSLLPENRETKFGTVDKQLNFNVAYNGFELDHNETLMGALTLLYKYSDKFNIKWISSVFDIKERENYSVQGRYVFQYPDSASGPGYTVGSNLNFGNNRLNTRVYSTEVRSYFQTKRSYLELGARYENDDVNESTSEYSRIDSKNSANKDTSIVINPAKALNRINVDRFMGFLENTFTLFPKFKLYAGMRLNYNSYTKEMLISPRIGMSVRSERIENLSYRLSAGVYNQPPFYSELQNRDGSLSSDRKAQHSLQFLAGTDYAFKNSPLTFTSELYYKKLSRLIPYKIEDLKIRYLTDEKSKGYAYGTDLSLNGEFVNGMKSFFRLSLMKTAEDIAGDSYLTKNKETIYPGYLRRPTDQRINFSIFFQDRLMENPSYKVHLNILYGSALITGPPQTERSADVYKIPAYKRMDIGFSKDFLEAGMKKNNGLLKRYFSSFTATAELFNILNIDNTVSYLWIRDANSNQYAVPNYLTSRQLNIRISANIKYK